MTEDGGSIGSDGQKSTRAARGRKPAYESRATEFRRELVIWRQTPESMRPTLRELAIKFGTNHQLLSFYLKGLPIWQAEEKAKQIRARAKAEGREMTMRECYDAIIKPGLFRKIEELRQAANRGPLNYWQIKMLKLLARRFPDAQELLQKHLHCALKRKSFKQIVKETPRLEDETPVAWVRRIWDQCAKYGTECPDEITEGLLQKLSQAGSENGWNNLPAEISAAGKSFRTV